MIFSQKVSWVNFASRLAGLTPADPVGLAASSPVSCIRAIVVAVVVDCRYHSQTRVPEFQSYQIEKVFVAAFVALVVAAVAA